MLMILSKVITSGYNKFYNQILSLLKKIKNKKTFQFADHIYKMLGRILKMLDSS